MFIRKKDIFAGIAALLLASVSGPFAEAQTAPADKVSFAVSWAPFNSGNATGNMQVSPAGDLYSTGAPVGQTVIERTAGGTSWTTVVDTGSTNALVDGFAVDGNNIIYAGLSTWQGNGLPGSFVVRFAPDGKSYTKLAGPYWELGGVAVDPAGDIYFIDIADDQLLEIPASGGPMKQIAGVGSSLASVATDAAGNLYVLSNNTRQLTKIAPNGTTTANNFWSISYTGQLAVDRSGNVFFGNPLSGGLYEVPANGPMITLKNDIIYGVAVDNTGHIFIEGSSGFKEGWFNANPTTSYTANVCPAGQTAPAPCSQNLDLTFETTQPVTLSSVQALTEGVSNRDFTLASSSCSVNSALGSNTLCEVSINFAPQAPGLRRGAVQFVAADGSIAGSQLISAVSVAPEAGFAPVQTVAVNGLAAPSGVAIDALGDVLVADSGNGRVLKVAGASQTVMVSGLSYPTGAALDGAGNLWITDSGSREVLRVTPGGVQAQMGTNWNAPSGIAVDGDGNALVIDQDTLVKISSAGVQTTVAGNLGAPSAIALDDAGNLYIADAQDGAVTRIDAAGDKTAIGSGWSSPSGVAVDEAGNVIVSDAGTGSVVLVSAAGDTADLASNLHSPAGLAVSLTGDIYVTVRDDNNVLELSRSTPPSLHFDLTPPNVHSSDNEGLTLESIGNAPLSIFGVTPSSGFLEVYPSNGIPECVMAPLAPGAACALAFQFQPSTAGNYAGTATISDNSLNQSVWAPAIQTVTLSGVSALFTQTVTLGPIPYTAPGSMNNLTASASSGLPVTITSLTPAVCSVQSNQLFAMTAGTCTVQAAQPGNIEYAAASTTSSLVINLNTQSIVFSQAPALAAKQVGQVGATATSGIYTSIASLTPAVCTIQWNSGDVASFTTLIAGTCTLQATQAGNSQYAAAAPVNVSFQVTALSQTVSIFGFNLSEGSTTVTASASSGLPVTFSSLTPAVCKLAQNRLTAIANGICTIQGTQAGNGVYSPASATYTAQAIVAR